MTEALRRIPAEELGDMATIGKQANTGVQKHGGRRTIQGKIAVSEKEGDCLGHIEPASCLSREAVWEQWLVKDADRNMVVPPMQHILRQHHGMLQVAS